LIAWLNGSFPSLNFNLFDLKAKVKSFTSIFFPAYDFIAEEKNAVCFEQ